VGQARFSPITSGLLARKGQAAPSVIVPSGHSTKRKPEAATVLSESTPDPVNPPRDLSCESTEAVCVPTRQDAECSTKATPPPSQAGMDESAIHPQATPPVVSAAQAPRPDAMRNALHAYFGRGLFDRS
jgi:hypothetical protein